MQADRSLPSLVRQAVCFLAVGFALMGCAQTQLAGHVASVASPERPKGHYKVGSPYEIKGVRYVPKEDFTYDQTGVASWYGPGFHGKRTANGEIFDSNALTAAHPTLQMPSVVRVTNLENGRSVVLRVNDRGPFANDRIIDVSRRGAEILGFRKQGVAFVRVQVMTEETLAAIPPADAARVRGGLAKGAAVPATAPRQAPISRPPQPERVVAQAPEPRSMPIPAERPVVQPTAAAPPQAAELNLASRLKQPALGSTQSVGTLPVPVHRPTVAQPASLAIADQPATAPQWYVQTGAFSRYDNAKRLGTRLTSLGRVEIEAIDRQAAGPLYRVRVGPFASQNEANLLAQAVVDAGINDMRVMVD